MVASTGYNKALTNDAGTRLRGIEVTKKNANDFADTPPSGTSVTDYDRQHLMLYARLLDAEADGAPLGEIVRILFGVDASNDPERAQGLYDGHLRRARWMAENGYRDLLHSQAS
ncbi:DUF2285 domain-containing protein [uncultured Roseobacter sp.]|uniref:DNA -binding domain-containing protein n=1 Tax=uncultured Roseobacter sp. TaxID=114847 RepID=UPI0026339B43|nr:DUF2285 domain-containing protein [uncultured Roseobacter sp.]